MDDAIKVVVEAWIDAEADVLVARKAYAKATGEAAEAADKALDLARIKANGFRAATLRLVDAAALVKANI